MLTKMNRKLHSEEAGFTLIELMVVILIIGILIAIALPAFLGARQRAQDKAATSDLRNGVAAGKTFFTDNDSYGDGAAGIPDFDATNAGNIEPSLKWAAAGDPGTTGNIAIVVASAGNLLLVRKSDSGTYFCLDDQAASPGGTHFGKGTNAYTSVDTVAECAALPAP